MLSTMMLSSRLGLLAAAAIALGGAGCRDRACLRWTDTERACPGKDEALARMTPACGDVEIESVDTLGEYESDDAQCCYDVTFKDGSEYVCGPSTSVGPGPGPTTGSPPDGGACLTCSQWLYDDAATYDDLCPKAQLLYDALANCVCITGCKAECFDTACSGVPGPQSCTACVQVACSVELGNCEADL